MAALRWRSRRRRRCRTGADAARRVAQDGADDRRDRGRRMRKTGNSVSVAVVDRAGRLRVFLQGDKAAPPISAAQRKAYRRAPLAAPRRNGLRARAGWSSPASASSNMSLRCGAACRSRSATTPSAPSASAARPRRRRGLRHGRRRAGADIEVEGAKGSGSAVQGKRIGRWPCTACRTWGVTGYSRN